MNSLKNNNNTNIHFKDLKTKQIVGLIFLTVFTISFIVLLCLTADKVDLKTKRLLGGIGLAGFLLFFAVDFIFFILPDDQHIANGIIKNNSYLFNNDFRILTTEKNKKAYEIIFTDDSETKISFMFFRKKYNEPYYAFFIYKNTYFDVYKLYDYFILDDTNIDDDNSGECNNVEYPEFSAMVMEILNFKKEHQAIYFKTLDLLSLKS